MNSPEHAFPGPNQSIAAGERLGWRSLVWKQAGLAALLVLLCTGTLAGIGHWVASGILRDQIHERLTGVASGRRQLIEAYSDQQRKYLELIASRTRLRQLVEQYEKGELAADEFRRETQPILKDSLRSAAAFQEIWICDPAGTVITDATDAHVGQNLSTDPNFVAGRERIHISPPEPTDDTYRVYVAGPIRNSQGRDLGVLMLQIDAESLLRLAKDRAGLGETGEVLVGFQQGDEVRYMFPARGSNEAVVPASDVPPMQHAIARETGFIDSKYGGERVLAVYQPVAYQPGANADWGLVAKMDDSEAYAPIDKLRWAYLLWVTVLVLISVLAAILLQRRLSRPLLTLAKRAKQFAAGDMDVRADVRTRDEVGVLSEAFNQLVEQVASSHAILEQSVTHRTEALVLANEAMAAEIAEHQKTELALRQSEALYQSLVESLPLCVFRKDAQGRIVFANSRLCETIGRSYIDLMGKRDDEIFPPEQAKKYRQDDARILATGATLEQEEEISADGRELVIQTLKAPVRNSDGEIVGVQGLFWDVTEARRAHQKAHTAAERTRSIIETAFDAFVAMDADGRVIDWNAQAEAIFGWSKADALGRSVAELIIPPLFREAHQNGLAHFLATGEGPLLNKRLEVAAQHRDGHEIEVELTIAPLRTGDSFVFSAFLHDITKRKQVHEELMKAKEAAEVASRAKSAFLANMSHEIRTPLNAIIGMTDLVLDSRLTPIQREYLSLVQDSGESLLWVINDILDFSKIEAGRLDLDVAPFLLRECLGDTLKALAFRAHRKQLELACHIDSDVPDALLGDAGRLRQVIVNLVGNAIKFTEQGEVVVDVRSQATSADDVDVTFAVRDTGIGVDPDKIERIFQPFEQADSTTTRRFGGTGLGLAISAKLVGLMGGRIEVESAPGRGSTFHFTVGMKLADQDSVKRRTDQDVDVEGVRVLVVDDNTTNRLILVEMLNNWHMQAVEVASARLALDAIRQARITDNPFHIVLTDGNMPDTDGFDLARQIREDAQIGSTIIMMLTSSDRPGNVALCEELGIAAYLMKPVKQSELFDAIALSLGRVVRADETSTRTEAAPAARPLRILVAEDSAVNQKLILGVLKKRGHDVTIANNGNEAIAALQADGFDLVLMDIQMPAMDGLEATRIIRAGERGTSRHMPIVAMTAHAMKGDREMCLEAGMDGYLAKPIRAAEVFSTIETILANTVIPAESNGSPSDKPSSAVVDWQAALEAVQGDEALLCELVGTFNQECPEQLATMQRALDQKDAPILSRTAHTLKGSLRLFGAAAAEKLAQKIESLGRSAELQTIGSILTDLRSETARVVEELSKFVERSSRRNGDGSQSG